MMQNLTHHVKPIIILVDNKATVGQVLNICIFSIFDELSVTERTHFDWQIHSNPSQQ